MRQIETKLGVGSLHLPTIATSCKYHRWPPWQGGWQDCRSEGPQITQDSSSPNSSPGLDHPATLPTWGRAVWHPQHPKRNRFHFWPGTSSLCLAGVCLPIHHPLGKPQTQQLFWQPSHTADIASASRHLRPCDGFCTRQPAGSPLLTPILQALKLQSPVQGAQPQGRSSTLPTLARPGPPGRWHRERATFTADLDPY